MFPDIRREKLREKLVELRAALDEIEEALNTDTPEPELVNKHFRLTQDGTFEMLLVVEDTKSTYFNKTYHYFFARHNGGAYPRAKTV